MERKVGGESARGCSGREVKEGEGRRRCCGMRRRTHTEHGSVVVVVEEEEEEEEDVTRLRSGRSE